MCGKWMAKHATRRVSSESRNEKSFLLRQMNLQIAKLY